MRIDQLRQEFLQAKTTVNAMDRKFRQAAASEGRELGPGEVAALNEAIREAHALKARFERAESDAEMVTQIEQMTAGMVIPGADPTPGRGGHPGRGIGAQFLASDTYRWLKQHEGSLPSGTWSSVASELPMMATTLTEDSGSGGPVILPSYLPGIVALPQRPLKMADLFAQGTTDSNTLIYTRESAYTNNAATVLEGGSKPESALTFASVTEPVRKVAHWLPVTDEMLSDSSAFASYLDARLRLGVELAIDSLLLNGSVTPPDVVGMLARTGLATSIARGSDNNADVILKQINAIQTATNLRPDGIVMHPTNWQACQLLKDANGNYLGGNGGPFAGPQAPTLWGLPVAVTSAIVAGTALVGAFQTAAQLFRRGGLRVEASNSHSDFFIKNLIAIRAEARLALCVYRPAAFGTTTSLV